MDLLIAKTKDNIFQTDELSNLMSDFNNLKLDKSADINELEKLKNKILENINAQLRLNELLNSV
jgi:hypothetical protein